MNTSLTLKIVGLATTVASQRWGVSLVVRARSDGRGAIHCTGCSELDDWGGR